MSEVRFGICRQRNIPLGAVCRQGRWLLCKMRLEAARGGLKDWMRRVHVHEATKGCPKLAARGLPVAARRRARMSRAPESAAPVASHRCLTGTSRRASPFRISDEIPGDVASGGMRAWPCPGGRGVAPRRQCIGVERASQTHARLEFNRPASSSAASRRRR